MTKIAVITPCFNAEPFIAACINSVALSITHNKFEIEHIIVDDGSTDNTSNVVIDQKNEKLHFFSLDKNHGNAYARNFAIEKINSDFIFCLDADDVIFQNSLLRLWSHTERLNADWVYGDFLRSNENLSYLPSQDYYGWEFADINSVLLSMFTGKHFFQHNCLYSQKTFHKAGKYDTSLRTAVDFDLFTRFLLEGIFPHYLSGPLYLHRFHGANLSSHHSVGDSVHYQNVVRFYNKYKDRLAQTLLPHDLKEIVAFIDKVQIGNENRNKD